MFAPLLLAFALGSPNPAPAPAQAPEAETVVLRVRSCSALVGSAMAVPEIEFSIYASPAVPVAAVAELARGTGVAQQVPPRIHGVLSETRLLYSGRTGADGEARIELALDRLPPPDDEGRISLTAVADSPSHCQRPLKSLCKISGLTPGTVRVLAPPGRTLVGRSVDSAGQGVPARLDLRGPGRRRDDALRVDDARSYADGRFEIDLRDARPRPLTLTVDAGAAGTAAIEGLTLESSLGLPTDWVLPVTGPGVVAGRVVDARGQPVAGLDLRVLRTRIALGETPSIAPGGARERALRTDELGSFEARGLAPGSYRVLTADWALFPDHPHERLTPAPVGATVADLELTYELTRLFVHAEPGMKLTADRYSSVETQWPTLRTAFLYPDEDHDRRSGDLWRLGIPGKPTDAGVAFELERPGRYLLLVLGGDGPLMQQSVEVASGQHVVPLAPHVRAQRGTVRLQAHHDSEGPFAPRVQFAIEAIDPPHVLFEGPPIAGSNSSSFELPVGRYRAVAYGVAWNMSHHGTLFRSREVGEQVVEFEVAADSALELPLYLEPGGFIDFSTAGEPSPGDFEATESSLTGDFFGADPDRHHRMYAGAVSVRLERHERFPETVRFIDREYFANSSAAGPHVWPSIRLGESQVSQMAPAGDFELVAELPGGRERRQRVRIEPGATMPVHFDFGGE